MSIHYTTKVLPLKIAMSFFTRTRSCNVPAVVKTNQRYHADIVLRPNARFVLMLEQKQQM